jgi:phosphoribosylformylglycinamidine synthase
MVIAILKFPGTTGDMDVYKALKIIEGAEPIIIPSRDSLLSLDDAEGIIIPGGYTFGDYLRPGSLAAMDELMDDILEAAASEKPILGINNGFQILTEIGLLPGVLLQNQQAQFVCKWVYLRVCEERTLFTESLAGLVIRIPIAHEYGNYYCSDTTLMTLHEDERVPFRYCNSSGEPLLEFNPNGSIENIAGVVNEKGNILGMMPHPERACRNILGSVDGLTILENFVRGTKVA